MVMKRMSLNFKILPFTILFLAGACLLRVDNIRADSVVLPNYAATNQINDAGEGMFNGVSREQTVYRASEFPPFPIIINEIRWRPDSITGGPIVTTISNIQVNLSITPINPDQLTSTFSQNTGTNDTLVFSG